MKKQSLVVIHEFGTLIKKDEKVFLNDKEDEVELSEITFSNLWDFILENKKRNDKCLNLIRKNLIMIW